MTQKNSSVNYATLIDLMALLTFLRIKVLFTGNKGEKNLSFYVQSRRSFLEILINFKLFKFSFLTAFPLDESYFVPRFNLSA